MPLAIFASEFAASALEVVLLLAFQVLYGSLYQLVGLIVTMFMAGLAVGALGMNRMLRHSWREKTASTASWDGKPSLARSKVFSHQFLDLSKLAFLLAGLALLLPLILPLLGRLSGTTASSVAVQAAIPGLTLMLAILVGMEFPLASHVEYNGAATTVSRLYLADFIGACLGALLASTLLIPLFGVTAVCLVTAALNILGGVAVRLRKAAL